MPVDTNARDLNIVAHIDDDLLFMNPDISASIRAGNEVTTIYTTAGDAGQGEEYWRGREEGGKAAYAVMAGASDWVDETVTIQTSGGDFDIASSYLASNPGVRLYFMRLPDGARGGLEINNFESLDKLENGRIDTVSAVDGSATYTRAQVVDVLAGLANVHAPTQFRVQDHESFFADQEHADHQDTSILTDEAIAQHQGTQYAVTSYVHYGTSGLPSNLTGDDLQLSIDVFQAYGAYDLSVIRADGSYANEYYEAWPSRQYIADETYVGEAPTNTISGTYFIDGSGDATLGLGERGMIGAPITLIDARTNAVIETTTAGINGGYSFRNLDAGTYRVSFEAPGVVNSTFEGSRFVAANQGPDAIDSDVSLGSNGVGLSDIITVNDGARVEGVNAGITSANTTSISGRYFVDANNNGAEDAGEEGVAGARIQLYDDRGYIVVAQTTTDEDGNYTFYEVAAHPRYAVFIEQPELVDGPYAGYRFSSSPAGTASTVNVDVGNNLVQGTWGQGPRFAIEHGQSITDIDGGIYTNAFNANDETLQWVAAWRPNEISLLANDTGGDLTVTRLDRTIDGLYVSIRENGDIWTSNRGAFSNLAPGETRTVDVTYEVTNAAGLSEMATVSLEYTDPREPVAQESSVSGRYFVDTDQDGIQDRTEEGVADATVYLYDDIRYRILAETQTDANGNYRFDDVDPHARLAVFFEDPNSIGGAYADYTFTLGNFGSDDTVDSDVRSQLPDGRGEVDRFAIVAEQSLTNVDAGIRLIATTPATPTASEPLFYALGTGTDDFVFQINAATGVISAKNWFSPNPDDAWDANEDNIFEVTRVLTSADGMTRDEDYRVAVTDQGTLQALDSTDTPIHLADVFLF